jgi:HEPN domain-containing protein
MKKLTREWVQKAEEDVAAARRLAKGKPVLKNGVCFHCQQAAEKYFRALLQEFGLPIPFIHDLVDLHTILLMKDSSLNALQHGLAELTHFAVDVRYPGKKASIQDSRSSLKLAENVRQEIRARLGLKTKRRSR